MQCVCVCVCVSTCSTRWSLFSKVKPLRICRAYWWRDGRNWIRTDMSRCFLWEWTHVTCKMWRGRVQMSRLQKLLAQSLCILAQLENWNFTVSCYFCFLLATKQFVLKNACHWESQWQTGGLWRPVNFMWPCECFWRRLANFRCAHYKSLSLSVFSRVTSPQAMQNFSWHVTMKGFNKICRHISIFIQIKQFYICILSAIC
jgi:hypothetical protein